MVRLDNLSAAAEIIRGANKILIVAHEKPDGDAFGSALGLGEFLREQGMDATVLLPDPIPAKFEAFGQGAFDTSIPDASLAEMDLIVALDSANSKRVALGNGRELEATGKKILNIDHHIDNSVNADWSYVDGDAAATAQLVYELAEAMPGTTISPRVATLLLIGLMTDTGSFRFQNTSGAALRVAAGLRERKADWEAVVNAAFFSKSRNQQLFEADLLCHHVKSAFGGRFLYAMIPDELFAEYQFDMRDGEAIIDLLREVAGTVIAVICYRRGDAFKFSSRSKDSRYPVGPIARAFGGGGHQMAAGATIAAGSLAEAEALILQEVKKVLEP